MVKPEVVHYDFDHGSNQVGGETRMVKTTETVGAMTVAQFRALLEEVVRGQLLDLLGDPDEGLALLPEVRERLLTQQGRVRRGERGVCLDEAAARLKL
jgi:hypothetical protein